MEGYLHKDLSGRLKAKAKVSNEKLFEINYTVGNNTATITARYEVT